MATSMRGNAGGGKEKRGTSPSSSIIKKTPKPLSNSSSSSTTGDEKTSSPKYSSKPVPNYLKATISSSLDFNRHPKKSSTDTSASKPTCNRRRSFDRPPPASQVHRAIRSPSGLARDIKSARSSSFSNKSATSSTTSSSASTRPASEKLFARTSSLKDGKTEPHFSKSRSLKKSTLVSLSAKKEPTLSSSSSSSSKKKAPKSVTSESSVDYENRPSVDHLDIEDNDDLVNLDDHEVQSLPEMSEMPDSNQELADPTTVEEEIKQIAKDSKGSTWEEDDHHRNDEVADQVLEEAAAEESEETDHQTVEESADVEAAEEHNLTEEGAGDEQDEAEVKAPEADPTETLVEENKEEADEEVKEGETEKAEADTDAKDDDQTVSSPPAASSETAAVNTQQPSSAGKKDKQAYNDVIEQTATKLMGGRKNKVLALAGAFETVISLQDTNKS